MPGPATGTSAVYALDTFTRVVSSGWGASDVGGRYSYDDGPSSFSVDGTHGVVTVTRGKSAEATLRGATALNLDETTTFALGALPSRGRLSAGLVLRRSGTAASKTEYEAMATLARSGRIVLAWRKSLAGHASTIAQVRKGRVAPRTAYRLRIRASGVDPTTLKLKLWPRAETEPSGWTLTATDSEPRLQRTGIVGVRVLGSPMLAKAVTVRIAQFAATATPDMGATGFRALIPPAFTPIRTLTATTPAQFVADVANLQPGDELDVEPMTIAGNITIDRSLSAYAEIHFAPGVVFSGPTTRGLYTFWITRASNIRMYGGELTNPANGGCVRIDGSTNVLWWNFKLHDCAADGILATSVNKSSTGIDLDGEIYNVAYDRSFDPHAEKCTGLHGAYLGGTSQSDNVTFSGKFSLYVHDVPCGSAVQAGSNLSNAELWVKAANITFNAQSQVAGNAIQFWGGALNNITVHEVTGDRLAGRVVETNGMYSCCNSHVVVEYGRGTNTLRNPLLSRVNYAPNPAVAYQDVRPLP